MVSTPSKLIIDLKHLIKQSLIWFDGELGEEGLNFVFKVMITSSSKPLEYMLQNLNATDLDV